MGDSEFIMDVYSLIWANAPVDPNTTLKQGNLEDMDVLVVPGGPHANQSQVSLTLTKEIPEPKNTPPAKDKNYASARAMQRTRPDREGALPGDAHSGFLRGVVAAFAELRRTDHRGGQSDERWQDTGDAGQVQWSSQQTSRR